MSKISVSTDKILSVHLFMRQSSILSESLHCHHEYSEYLFELTAMHAVCHECSQFLILKVAALSLDLLDE